MARPKKPGMDYFPVDVNRLGSTKMRVVQSQYGAVGCLLYFYIVSAIMRSRYYADFNEDFVCCSAADMNMESGRTAEIIRFMCKKGLFDEDMCLQKKIITSKEIQETYFEVECSRGRGASVRREYWLLSGNSDKLAYEDDLSASNEDLPQNNPLNKTKRYDTEQNSSRKNEDDNNGLSEAVRQFNAVCTELPKLSQLTAQREKALKEAVKLLNGRSIEELFRKTAASDFLCGRVGSGWKASFDWILKPDNLAKIMEGNYDNKTPPTEPKTDYTCGGKYVNAMELSGDIAPENYPF